MIGTRKPSAVVAVACATVLAGAIVVRAAGPLKGHGNLVGYQEVPTLSTPATGTIDMEISKDGNSVAYTLSYQGIATNVLFAHIHLGRRAVNGGIMVFLCTNSGAPSTVPVPPPCPQGGGTVSGELTAADVLAISAQGVAAGDFDAFVDALLARAGYANLHSSAFPGGEIRGQVTFRRADSIKDK
jgi:hypothetical protein